MTTKRYNKPHRKEFVEGVIKILGISEDDIKNKSSRVEISRDRHDIHFNHEKIWFETKFGPLEIRGITASKQLLSVFQAFRDSDQYGNAVKSLGSNVNQYTGKWNFHLSGGDSIEEILDYVKWEYRNIELGNRIDIPKEEEADNQ